MVRALVTWVIDLNLSPMMLLITIIVIYIVLGCFIESLSMMLLTLPLFFPIVEAAGFDPIWFAIILMIIIEKTQNTPKVK